MIRILLIPLLLLFAGCTPAQDINQAAEGLAREQPKWLYSPAENACPADVMTDQPAPVRYLGEVCIENPKKCVEGCKAGGGNDCFAMALAVEPIRGYTKLADRLFYRACSLGVVSACSNRASSMNTDETACQVRTYEKACNRSDAWACLTLGMYLARGMGVERDLPRARKLITESCELVDDEEWCAYGLDMLMEIDRIEKKQRDRMISPDAGSGPPLLHR
jgi:TPR repeat protein